MNKNLVFVVVVLAVFAELVTPKVIGGGNVPPERLLPKWDIKKNMEVIEQLERELRLRRLRIFMEAIGMLESNNTYDVVNRYGMLGKYQFSPTTIEYLGYNVTKEEFLSNPDLQDEVMLAYLQANYRTLYDYIMEYDGKKFKGITLNTASILAGAHFAGATGLREFLDSASDSVGVVDGNGMSLRNYMSKFSQYEVEIDA